MSLFLLVIDQTIFLGPWHSLNVLGAVCFFSAVLDEPVEALDSRRPIFRPLPHVAVLRDELTQLFDEDYLEEEEEAEARGEHTLSEKFSKHTWDLQQNIALCPPS